MCYNVSVLGRVDTKPNNASFRQNLHIILVSTLPKTKALILRRNVYKKFDKDDVRKVIENSNR